MKLFIAFLVATSSLSTVAQLSGEISYTTVVNLHRMFGDDERGKRMKEFVPETSEFQNQLIFTADETVYKNVADADEEEVTVDQEGPGQSRSARMMNHMKKRMAPPNDIIYCDVENGLIVAKKEFMDKTFLIRDTLNMATWKITGEMKEVSGMNCMKAEFIPTENDTDKVVAWFTPEIAVSSGPAGYGGLPGLIIHLDKNDGEVVISISNMVMREIEKKEIQEPKKGKEVSEEEFRAIVKKKMEEQRASRGGRGGRPHHH